MPAKGAKLPAPTPPLPDDPARTKGAPSHRRRFNILAISAIGILVTAVVLGCAIATIPAARFALQDRPTVQAAVVVPPRMPLADTPVNDVWMVESTDAHELYSNGLRIEREYTIRHLPRTPYRTFRADDPDHTKFDWRSGFAGIVFHTTESQIAPLRQESLEQLKVNARGVLHEVQRKRAYHYVIDRVGRVWRVVDESDIAWHAGRSVWADDSAAYVDLNDSFLGVSFEAQTNSPTEPVATQAQIRSARSLVEMLRAKYKISAANCVTHAQVSVSMFSGRIGYHTDWSADFPFEAVGLPNNYKIPTPALWAFGFEYDKIFEGVMGNRLWPGLSLAEQHLERVARKAHTSSSQVRKQLQDRYRAIVQSLETDDEDGHAHQLQQLLANETRTAQPAPAVLKPVSAPPAAAAVPPINPNSVAIVPTNTGGN